MSLPFSREKITRNWQPLNWQTFDPLDEDSRRYAAYYGIDFDSTFADLEYGFGYFKAAGYTISVHSWRPEAARGTVLICHGYFDHVGLYRHLIGHVLELGYAVLAYDLPGHGLSSGTRAAIEHFRIYREVLEQCLAQAANDFPSPWHVIAQSTGAAIVMDYLLHHGLDAKNSPFEQIILLAPLVRPFKWGTVRWLHALVRPFAKSVKRVFTVNSGDADFLDFLENKDPLQDRRLPTAWISALKTWLPGFEAANRVEVSPVVIQGDQDETVDWRYNLGVIRSKFDHPKVHMLTGARHHLVNEKKQYREKILAIIDHYLGD